MAKQAAMTSSQQQQVVLLCLLPVPPTAMLHDGLAQLISTTYAWLSAVARSIASFSPTDQRPGLFALHVFPACSSAGDTRAHCKCVCVMVLTMTKTRGAVGNLMPSLPFDLGFS